MSAYIYGVMTKKRLDADAGQSTDQQPPGIATYVDAFAALVPAEVLAAQAFITGLVTEETTKDGVTTTVITYPNVVKGSFVALLVVSWALYVFGLRKWPVGWGLVRMVIPPIAFAGWTSLQPHTFFDVAFPGFAGVPAEVTAVILAVVLAVVANRLGSVADGATPPTPPGGGGGPGGGAQNGAVQQQAPVGAQN